MSKNTNKKENETGESECFGRKGEREYRWWNEYIVEDGRTREFVSPLLTTFPLPPSLPPALPPSFPYPDSIPDRCNCIMARMVLGSVICWMNWKGGR